TVEQDCHVAIAEEVIAMWRNKEYRHAIDLRRRMVRRQRIGQSVMMAGKEFEQRLSTVTSQQALFFGNGTFPVAGQACDFVLEERIPIMFPQCRKPSLIRRYICHSSTQPGVNVEAVFTTLVVGADLLHDLVNVQIEPSDLIYRYDPPDQIEDERGWVHLAHIL